MYRALVCCRAGMGTSMLLKTKADQVIHENGYPIVTEHGNLDSLLAFDGDVVITMNDLAEDLKNKIPYVIAVNSAINKEEIKKCIEEYLSWKKNH